VGALIRHLAVGAVGAVILVAACTDAVGPNPREARLIVQPSFAEMPTGSQSQNPAHLVDNIRILIRNLADDVVVDQVAQWPIDQDTLSLDVVVQVTGTQSFDLEIHGRIGDRIMFRAGPLRLQLTGGAAAPAQVRPVLEFAGPEASVTAVEIRGAPDVFMAGSTVALSALATLPDGSQISDPLMEWTSTDPAAASIGDDGVVQVHHDASRTVTITGRVAYTDVTATVSGPVRPTSVAITAESVELTAVGDELELQATLLGADGAAVTGGAITWASRSPGIVLLAGGSGGPVARVQAVRHGEAWVVAEAGPLSDSLLVRVRQAPARLVLTGTAGTLRAQGETTQLEADVRDSNDNPIVDPEVIWSSSDPAVATVDGSGMVSAVGDGHTWITATSGEAADSILITVAIPLAVARVLVTPSILHLERLGETGQLTAQAFDQHDHLMADAEIVWQSLNPNIVGVDGSGVVTALGHGPGRIVASANGFADTATVHVAGGWMESVVITPGTATIPEIGGSTQLIATGRDRFGDVVDGIEFVWSSLNPSVAVVSQGGVVTAVGNGTARIVATSEPFADTATVTVEEGEIIFGSSVLYFTDYTAGTDRILTGLEELAEEGIIDLTIAQKGNRDDLLARMSDNPDIVVYFNQNTSLRTIDRDSLVAWVQSGKRLIYSDWTRNAVVFAAMEAAPGQRVNESSLTFLDDRLAEGVQQPMPLMNPGWGIYSTGLIPIGDAVSVCSFPSGESCLVYGNQGRTVTVGFLNDTVTEEDGRNFGRNLLRIVVQGETMAARAPADALSRRSMPAVPPQLAPRDGQALPTTNALPAARSGGRR
jgi:uncharacterized protein YjdB